MGIGWSSKGPIISGGFRPCYQQEKNYEDESYISSEEDEGEDEEEDILSIQSFHFPMYSLEEGYGMMKKKAMNETSVQTEDLIEDDLDWDLSDSIDRETQTLPPNATHFQRNRVEAIVQTDYRYFPLAMRTNRDTFNQSKETMDAGTQTEQSTNSVSTQTCELLLNQVSNLSASMDKYGQECKRLSSTSSYSSSHMDSSSDESDETDSVETISECPESSSTVSPIITRPLIPNNIISNQLTGSATRYSTSTPQPGEEMRTDRRDALELWRRLAPFALDELMPSFKMANKAYKRMKTMVDVSIQTENDLRDDRDPNDPFPPSCNKTHLLQKVNIKDIDSHALSTPPEVTKDPERLVEYLCKEAQNDLYKARVIFRWITDNIRFDWRYLDKERTIEEILRSQAGVVKDFVQLFAEMSSIAGLKVKVLHGFARGYNYKLGRTFEPGKDPLHSWIAVFIFDSWRFIDPTWGAGYLEEDRRFQSHLEEHFFLTDPIDFIYTHIPWNEGEENHERWQLLADPMPLGEFNLLPKVTPEFFVCCLRLRKPKFSPIVFSQQTEIQVASSLLLRYKFNFYPDYETEERPLNEWVFCQLKEGGVVGSFTVIPPFAASFVLKVYAKSDEETDEEREDQDIPHAFSFLLKCTKSRKHPVPWPLHDSTWGPTPKLYECGLYPVNQPGPVIYTWGGRKVMYMEKVSDVLLMFQIFDRKGVLLEPKGIVKKEECEDQISISIVPPDIGFFKLLIYGISKPNVRGVWRLPLLACYLVECKMSVVSATSKDSASTVNKPKPKKRMVVARR